MPSHSKSHEILQNIRQLLLLIALLPLAYLITTLRLGGVVPDDYVESSLEITELRFNDWKVYGHEEWKLLALKFSKQQKSVKAEIAAKHSLATNPGYAISAVLLMNIYLKTGEIEKAKEMYELSKSLHPAQHSRLFKE